MGIKRIRKHIGRRGLIMGFLGFIALVIGLGSIGNPPSTQARLNAQVISSIAPMTLWYVLWTWSGVLCTLGAFWHGARPWAVASFSFLAFVFGIGYLAAEPFAHGDFRAWIPGVLYLGFGMLMIVISGWEEGSL